MMSESNDPPAEESGGQISKPLRSYGRRRGRKLSARKTSLLTGGLERLRLDLSKTPPEGGLSALFQERIQETWLEIGFGAGEHLVWQAEHNPRTGIIGAEPYINGVVAAVSAIEAGGHQDRVRFHADDVRPLLEWLPPVSLSRAFVLFPDPWPKKRHRARRLFAPPLLDAMARLLKPGSELRFASDIADYAEEAIKHACGHPAFDLTLTFTSTNRSTLPDWPITRYETKAMREGHCSTFIVLKRKAVLQRIP
jgi:tRNA (guanine-N7-)-methyltransferase